ncbi:hypothetical protein RIVM261_073070 [Rivularia sp. IAM M-261]|nr:hypothetical protein RIVM261_073070 [Rivularia sp. IAM M-261]
MQQLKSAQNMPGSFGVPIIGDLQFAFNEGYSLLQSWQRYGEIFKMRLLGQKCAVLIGAEANKLVLVEQERGREEDKKVPFSLLGFGGGAHVCIGREFALLEIKVFLATLLRHYRFSVTPEYSALAPVLVPPKTQNQLRTYNKKFKQ